MKLYKVTLRGMTYSIAANGTVYGISYVVATSPSEAYNIVRNALDETSTGFVDERELDKIELIAEDTSFPSCKIRLYIRPEGDDVELKRSFYTRIK